MLLGVTAGDVVADFEPGFGQARQAFVIELFSFKVIFKRFGVGVVVAITSSAYALLGIVLGD